MKGRILTFTYMGILAIGLTIQPIYAKTLRPLETEDANTLPKGQLDFSISIEYLDEYVPPFSSGPGDGEVYELPRIGLAYGIADNVELQVDWVLLNVDYLTFDKYGSGDPRIFTKINFWQEEENRPALGMRFGAKIPSGDEEDGLGTNEADFFISGLASKQLGPLTGLLNLGLAILGDPGQNSRQDDVMTYGIALDYPINDQFDIAGEIIGQAFSNDDNDKSLARLGARYNTGNFSWDASAALGLSDKTEDFRIGAGLTYHLNTGE